MNDVWNHWYFSACNTCLEFELFLVNYIMCLKLTFKTCMCDEQYFTSVMF